MLTNEVMGLLALGILWVNTLLIVGAAMKRFFELGRWLRAWRPLSTADLDSPTDGLISVTVSERFAQLEIDQVGRWASGRPAILWHDRAYRSSVNEAQVSSELGPIDVGPAAHASVWPSSQAVAAAAACPSAHAFDDAYKQAKKARGFSRTLNVSVGAPGKDVWLAGRFQKSEDSVSVQGSDDLPLIVSANDPRGWARGRRLGLAGFGALSIIGAAICTAVALVPPVFGLVSTLGGALGVAFFLLIQPAGTAIRDWARSPNEAVVRGRWLRPSGETAPRSDEPSKDAVVTPQHGAVG